MPDRPQGRVTTGIQVPVAVVAKRGSTGTGPFMRNRWEYSHLVRAVLSGVALIAMLVALAI